MTTHSHPNVQNLIIRTADLVTRNNKRYTRRFMIDRSLSPDSDTRSRFGTRRDDVGQSDPHINYSLRGLYKGKRSASLTYRPKWEK